ncbi:MAG: aldo/keto reductase [Thermoguttaceae bacterium]|jgi:diketogulonate reductase-like aldo/keto reductase
MSTKTSLTDTFKLRDGHEIPCIGFGTWQTPDGDIATQAVKDALAAGYRHVDTASAYENEESVGKGIKESGLKRDDIFLTTKLWNSDRGYESALSACQKSLERLDLEYIDLYLIHWPANDKTYDDPVKVNKDTWRAFEKLQKDGLVRSIGLSNFLEPHIKQLLDDAEILPAVDQIEIHPGFPQFDTIKYCKENDILVEAWSPLGCGRVLSDERLIKIAEKYSKSVAQLCIRWALQHDVLPLPKSTHKDRIISNTQVFDFVINDEDMKTIDELPQFGYSTFNPDTVTF